MSLGITEIILILVVVLVLFGGKKIPELAQGLGKAQAEYKKAKAAIENEVNEFKNEVAKAAEENRPLKTSSKKAATKVAKKSASVKKVSAKKTATTKTKVTRKTTKK